MIMRAVDHPNPGAVAVVEGEGEARMAPYWVVSLFPSTSLEAKGLPVQYARVEVKLVEVEVRVVEAEEERREAISARERLIFFTRLAGRLSFMDTTARFAVEVVELKVVSREETPHREVFWEGL